MTHSISVIRYAQDVAAEGVNLGILQNMAVYAMLHMRLKLGSYPVTQEQWVAVMGRVGPSGTLQSGALPGIGGLRNR